MKLLFKYLLLLVLSLLYFFVVVPGGACVRLVSDRLRLRRDEQAATYFQMFESALPRIACARESGANRPITRN
uniref:Uncharacterized protein n=1 Tax=Burkholderia sp. (strain CCGE1003) TaxID=640512 RepID=E1T9H6_BURSG